MIESCAFCKIFLCHFETYNKSLTKRVQIDKLLRTMVEVCASAYKMLYRGEEFHPAHRRQFMAFTTIAVAGKGGTGKTTFAAF